MAFDTDILIAGMIQGRDSTAIPLNIDRDPMPHQTDANNPYSFVCHLTYLSAYRA